MVVSPLPEPESRPLDGERRPHLTLVTDTPADEPETRDWPCCVSTDGLWLDPQHTHAEVLILGYARDLPGLDPYRGDVQALLPIKNEQYAEALRGIEAKGLARIDRPPRGTTGPEGRLHFYAFHPIAYPRDDNKTILLPLRLTARLCGSRKGALPACRLLGLYHREQRRAGLVQVGDKEAAYLLGWSNVDTVARSRARLEEVRLIEQVRKAGGRCAAAIYALPDAHARALPEPERFEPDKTRYLRPSEFGVVYASLPERKALAQLAALLSAGNPDKLAALSRWVESQPRPPHASHLFDLVKSQRPPDREPEGAYHPPDREPEGPNREPFFPLDASEENPEELNPSLRSGFNSRRAAARPNEAPPEESAWSDDLDDHHEARDASRIEETRGGASGEETHSDQRQVLDRWSGDKRPAACTWPQCGCPAGCKEHLPF